MSKDQSSSTPGLNTSPFNVVVGGAGIGLLLAAAAVAYWRSQKRPPSKIAGAFESARPSGMPAFSFKGKWAINAAIKMIEHDASRKVLLTVLKSIAKRAK